MGDSRKDLVVRENQARRIPGSNDPIDQVKVGDWFWVTDEDEDEDGNVTTDRDLYCDLYCVAEIGSNYFEFKSRATSGGEWSFRLHFDNFVDQCEREENWKAVFEERARTAQKQIKEKTQELVKAGQALCLLAQESQPQDGPQSDSFLPAVVTQSPDKYKTDLVKFRDDKMPAIQDEIKELNQHYSAAVGNMAYRELCKLHSLKSALAGVEDKIFVVELYCGIEEQIHHILEGKPASLNESIVLRQQMLYMDEETLFDYRKGGMDHGDLNEFDEWVVRPENLERILPEPKSLVAFRVRRGKKNYGRAETFLDAWTHAGWSVEDMKTYLLIRNGGNVYRIATAIDFSPRLIPFKNEIGEKQFIKERSVWGDRKNKKPEFVTSDSVHYDDHVKKQDKLMRQYNRIIVLVQGLLDRSMVFHPHPSIKLHLDEHMVKYFTLLRDEEMGLPNKAISMENYTKQVNSKIKFGDYVWSDWVPDNVNRYDYKYLAGWERDIIDRPNFAKVTSIRRDKSEVRITWGIEYCKYKYDWRGRRGSRYNYEDAVRNRHLWVPLDKVFNLNGYEQDDYKMFLCDRTLKGEYLKWAPQLLTAEDMAREKIDITKFIVRKKR